MKTSFYIRVLYASAFSCIYAQSALAADLSASIGERRLAAVAQARAGNFEQSLPELKNLVKEAPKDIGIIADYIVALTWANKPQEALALANTIHLQTAPIYCVNALAKAARDVGDFTQALSLYEQLISRQAGHLDPVFGKTLTLIDLKQFQLAEVQISQLCKDYPKNPDVYRAMSYLGQATQQPIVVIDANTRLLAINPQDNEAARQLIIASNEAGASQQAAALAQKYPNAVDKNTLERIANDSAAHHLAWGHYKPQNPAQRFADIDIALAKLDALCRCDWSKLDLSSDKNSNSKNKNLLFDRIVGLRDRYRMNEVIAHHQQLTQAKLDLPDYVLNALGDAYLYKRQPEQALNMYEESLVKNPQNVQISFAKFYALIETEQFDAAYKLIDDLSKNQAIYRNRPKNPVVREGQHKLDADMKAAYARAYGDNLAPAQLSFQKLLAVGPLNKELQLSLAEIWRWRGWPEMAEQKFAELNKAQPNHLQAKVDLAHAHLDLRDWKVAENEIKPLVKEYPENSAVNELGRRWQLHTKRQLIMDANTTGSSGGTFGSRENIINAQLYSRPFKDNYRAFIATNYNKSSFQEGAGKATFAGGGLEYTDRDWRITTTLGGAGADASGVNVGVTAEYRLDDYWSFGTGLELNTNQMPLRGLKEGINADLLYANARYRWSDLDSVDVGANYVVMEDGNHRQAFNVAFSNRFITQPHYKLNLNTRLDASKNKQEGVLYFNPERDLELTVVADNVWTQWRRYDSSFSHRLQLGVGQYWQKNFGSNNTWMMSYEQQIKWDDSLEFAYGVRRNLHPYDGVDEYFTQYFCRLNWLF